MNKVIPVLYTTLLRETMDFYCSILGFQCDGFEPDFGWATVSKDGVEIMLTLPNEHMEFEAPIFTGSLYIKTNRIDSIWSDVKDKVKVSYPLETFEYGMKEFGCFDNNGYLIQFGEEIVE